jgi:hypothetical protein
MVEKTAVLTVERLENVMVEQMVGKLVDSWVELSAEWKAERTDKWLDELMAKRMVEQKDG